MSMAEVRKQAIASAAADGNASHAVEHASSMNFLANWRAQAIKLARAEDLRRAYDVVETDVVVRARLDCVFTGAPVSIRTTIDRSAAFAKGQVVYAYGGLLYGQPFLRDWIFVTSARGVSRLLRSQETSRILHNSSFLCNGFCQESQFQLQVLHSGAQMLPLHRNWSMFAAPERHQQCS